MGDDAEEKSPGGSRIVRHEAREREWSPPAEIEGMEQIEEHFARFFGKSESVFHEIASDLIHVDVHLIPPAPGRDHWTLFTTGMSDLAMTVPEGAEEDSFAELVLMLPADWDLEAISVTPPPDDLERWYWPIRWLKHLARFPHQYGTWLSTGHTIPSADPPTPFHPGTALCCWLLMPPAGVPPEAETVHLADGRVVNLLVMHALHLDEMTLKLEKGTDALMQALARAKVGPVLRPGRPSARRRKLFGLF